MIWRPWMRRLTEKVGAGNGADLTELTEVLESLKGVMADQLAKRGIGDEAGGEAGGEAGAEGGAAREGGGGGGRRSISGEIGSREDVIRMLDKINDYYERYEPSSPVPIFMTRAKRLATMNFTDLVKDLTPEAVDKLNLYVGEPPAA